MKQPSTLPQSQIHAIITDLIDKITKFYCIKDKTSEISKNLKISLENGKYNSFTEYSELAHQLTVDLQQFSKDFHFWVSVKSPKIENGQELEKLNDESFAEEEICQYTNCDIIIIERLAGNIGYIKLYEFSPVQFAAPIILNALECLKQTDAIIIDVRFNGGGDSRLVQFIISYFSDNEPIHIYDFHNPKTGTSDQTWTLPYVGTQHHPDKHLYILTSHRSASAAEDLAYSLQSIKRAIIIGEVTRGAANAPETFEVAEIFDVEIPVYRPVNVETKTNWEQTGVKPDIQVTQEKALETAHLHAITILDKLERKSTIQAMFQFEKEYVYTLYNSIPISQDIANSLIGKYRSISIESQEDKLVFCHKNVRYPLITPDNNVFYLNERSRIRFSKENNSLMLIYEFREPWSAIKYQKET